MRKKDAVEGFRMRSRRRRARQSGAVLATGAIAGLSLLSALPAGTTDVNPANNDTYVSLNLSANRTRQAAITKEIIEIVSGAAAAG